MGFMNYFKVSTTVAAEHVEAEKTKSRTVLSALESASSPRSSRTGLRRSYQSTTTSMTDETKHQVMLSYIYQQQQNLMWIKDTSGESEGLMIRRSKHNYLYSPPQLANSPLAHAMDILNVQVSHIVLAGLIKIMHGINVFCRLL